MDDELEPAAGEPAMPAPPPASPTRSRKTAWIAAVVLVVLVGGVVAAVNLNGDDVNTYADHGVTFQYPGDWRELGAAEFSVESGQEEWVESFFSGPGSSGVIVTEYTLLQDVTGFPESQLLAELQGLLDQTVPQAGGQILEALAPTTVGDFLAFRTVFTTEVDGTSATTDMVMVFQGTRQWNIQCQSVPETEDEVMAGCRQVRDTFSVTG